MAKFTKTAIKLGTTIAVVLMAGTLWIGCSEKPEVFSFDPQEGVLDYIETHPVAADLFATSYLFPELPYTKPTDTAAVFIDRVDSSYREIRVIDAAGVQFESPIGETDMAEATVSDWFLISTERVTADTTEVVLVEWRVVVRHGLFLHLGSNDRPYLGWVLHGFSGGYPRDGLTQVQSSSGLEFRADGLNQNELRYLVVFGYYKRDSLGIDRWIVDTTVGRTNFAYQVLGDITEIPQGDTLVISTTNMDGDDYSSGTVYQLLTTETSSGRVVRSMTAPDHYSYVDTFVTPVDNSREWNIILFQEFRRPDRQGAIWVTPYRTDR